MATSSVSRRSGILSVLAFILGCGISSAAEINPAAVAFKLPEQIEWKDPLGVSGAKQRCCSAIRPSPVFTLCSSSGCPAISAARTFTPTIVSSWW